MRHCKDNITLAIRLLSPDFWHNTFHNPIIKQIWDDIACRGPKASKRYRAALLKRLEALQASELPYVKSVADGTLYEDLLEDFIKAGHVKADIPYAKQRKKTKNLIISSLFDKTNCGRHKIPYSVWNILKGRHPEMVMVFDFIKRYAHKDMARILQRAEALFRGC